MSGSPRKKTFPTLHTAMECTSSPTIATTPTGGSGSSPSNISLQRESDNASPPTLPYTVNDMNTGINHIITEAMVREQLKGGPSPTNNNKNNSNSTPSKDDSITEYESPSQRLLKGLTTTCDGRYGRQQLLAPTTSSLNNIIMDSVPVEDVMRWKEFRRKQRTIASVSATTTEIDVDGFPVSGEDTASHDENGGGGSEDMSSKQQQLVLATSTSNSEVGTEIASNTARYLATQSNIMARQLMSSSEEGEDEEDQHDDDDTANTEDWGPPLDVGSDWDTPLNNKGSQAETTSKVEDCDSQNSVENHAVDNDDDDEGGQSSSFEGAAAAAAAPPVVKKEVPTLDEVHNFMNQLKQKSAVGRERDSIYAKSSDSKNNSNNNNSSKLSSSSPKVAFPPANVTNDTKPPPPLPLPPTSSAEVHKSLIEHRERMRQQQLEGERKRQEFDARLQLLRSQLHDEAADARLQLLRSKIHGDDNDGGGGGLTFPTFGNDSMTAAAAHRTVEQGLSENINQQKQPMSVLPGARWSGGLAMWSPSNVGNGGSATMRAKPTAPKLSSSSPHIDNDGSKQPQQQQQQSSSLQLLPPTGIGIDDDDFSFSPVDVDAVLGKSSGSSNKSVGELFAEAYGGEGRNSRAINAVDDDEANASTSSNSYAKKDSIIETYYSKEQPRIANLALDSLPPDTSPSHSNVSTTVTEGDKGGGLGSGYVSGFGDKSMASSVNVELGFGTKVDPPLEDEEEGRLLGVTVVGSKRRKRKSNSPWTSCETVEEQSKDSPKESDSVLEDGGGGHRRDPLSVALEPAAKDAPFERKQLDPDGIDWKDIPQHDAYSAVPLTPSSSWKKSIGSSLEETDNDQMYPDNVLSQKNDNLPPPVRVPPTPRMTPQAREGGNQFTPRSKRLPTPRATPRTVRAANLSSARKFGFGLEDESPNTSFKMNESPSSRRDNRIDEVPDESSKRKFGGRLEVHTELPSSHQSEMDASIEDKQRVDADEKEAEQIEDQTNEERSPTIKDIQSKFESKSFGIDHVHKSRQIFREETAVGAPKSRFRTNLMESPIKVSTTPSRIYLVDSELRAMSSLEIDTHASIEYSLNKGVSDENDATIGDSTLGAGTMDTKKALRYAKRLESLNESEDNSKENHEDEATPSIVALRRRAFESKQENESVLMSPDHPNKLETIGSQKDKRSLPNQRSLLSASNRCEADSREESRHVVKKPSQDHSSLSQSSPGGKTSVVASIKERIAAYDGQNGKNGMPSPYRLSSQSKTFQVRVGGQVKSINIRQGTNDKISLQKANSIANTTKYTAGADSPSRGLNQDKQYPALTANHGGTHKIQHGSAYFSKNGPLSNRNQAAGRNVAPIDTTFEYSTPDNDDDDGITLSPTISEVSGLTLPTLATSLVGGVVPDHDINQLERTMTPIARLRQKTQGNKFSYDHIDASTPRASMETNRLSRRDQIASRIRDTSSNGNLWQRRNVVTEVSHSTSGDTSSKSRNASMGYPHAKSASQGKVAFAIENIDGTRRQKSEEENMSVGDRVAMMNRQQHKMRRRKSMKDEQSSSLATRDCIRVD